MNTYQLQKFREPVVWDMSAFKIVRYKMKLTNIKRSQALNEDLIIGLGN